MYSRARSAHPFLRLVQMWAKTPFIKYGHPVPVGATSQYAGSNQPFKFLARTPAYVVFERVAFRYTVFIAQRCCVEMRSFDVQAGQARQLRRWAPEELKLPS